MRVFWGKLRTSLGFPRQDDFAEEIKANLNMLVEENIANGMSFEEALAAANRQFGNTILTIERTREAWMFGWLHALLQDVRYGLRGLTKNPGFTAVVVTTVALGIGATTAIFSVFEAAALRPLPYPSADRLTILGESNSKVEGISVTWLNFQHWLGENHTFDQMAGYETTHATMTGHGDPQFTRGAVVGARFFGLVGAKPLLGRFFTDAEDRPGASGTVVLAYDFWAKQFSEESAIGWVIHLDGKPYEVIGVAPPRLKYFENIDYYLSIGPREGRPASRGEHGSIRLLARLKPGVSLETGLAELDGIMRHLGEMDPGPESGHMAWGTRLAEARTRNAKPTLLLLLSAAGLVLLIACANVASLVLSRSTKRAREMALRSAIGAGVGRLARQLLTESILIATIGGALGLLLARAMLQTMLAVAPKSIPGLADTSLNGSVLVFTVAVTLLTGVLVGLAPLWGARKIDLVSALNEGSRSTTGGRRANWLRSALVVGEIAVTLMLTYVSGLLIHSLTIAQNSDPGFLPDRLLKVELVLPQTSYPSPDAQLQFFARLLENIRRTPGVIEAGAVNCAPSAGDCGDWFYSIPSKPAPARGDVPLSLFNTAETGYFRAMHIPIKQGRAFTDHDAAANPKVAIVNEVLAQKYWPDESPIGQRIKVGGPYIQGPMLEIVGVAGNVSQMGLDSSPLPEIYQPLAQNSQAGLTLMIRAQNSPESLMPQIRRLVYAQDLNLAIERIGPFDEALQGTLARRKFTTAILGAFAGLAVLLALVGIYGLLNYWVAVRENDIAIRMALGAPRWSIARWTGVEALRLAAIGVALGVGGGLAASRLVESMVFGVPAQSLVTIFASALFVMAVAMFAAAIPVWRAMRVDVIEQLHRA